MRSIFELISKHRSEVVIVPIIALAALIFTLFVYIFFNKRKWIKYVPGLIALVIGIVFMVQGYFELLNVAGLDFIAIGTKVLIFAMTVILFSIILDILDSISHNIKSMFNKDKKKTKTTKRV